MADSLNKLSIAWFSKIEIFERAFGQHCNELFLSAVKKVQLEDLAKDLVQEIYIALWDNLESIASEQEILPYLYAYSEIKCLCTTGNQTYI